MKSRRGASRAGKGPHKGRGTRSPRTRGTQATKKQIEGIIDVTRSGLGFLEDARGGNDIEIPRGSLNTALNRDRVRVLITGYNSARKRPIGEVSEVLERAKTQFVGTVREERGMLLFEPDDRRVYTPLLLNPKDSLAEPGMKVRVELTRWRNPHLNPEGAVLEVLGASGEHETEMRAAVAARGFDYDFPPPVLEAAARIAQRRDALLAEGVAESSRRDMRGIPTFTIDPADAKDFDDALSYHILPSGETEIGIHIADVTHFVRPRDAIDKEAAKRATSIYLVDRTIPMLPPILSEDLCSLKPNEDRLAFSCIATLRSDGTVTSRWFGRTVIHSHKRFTYEEAQTVIEGAASPHAEPLRALHALAQKLHARRRADGAISFDQDEVKFVLDERMKPIRVVRKARNDATALIEEFMLLANREVAQYVAKHIHARKDGLFVYRIHDVPNEEKLEELAVFLRAIGHSLRTEKGMLSVKDLNALFEALKGKPEEHLVKTATVRSMAKAVYSTKNIGHFGLAFEHYTHFTSPIRRYPDMMVHRILQTTLEGKTLGKEETARYEELSISSSEREVAAAEAERDSVKYKQVEYMSERVGQTFAGVISGVTEWGIYVEEKETKAEGMVRLTSLTDDTYVLDRPNFRVVGLNTKKQYSLGARVTVRLERADLEERTLDFAFTAPG